MRERIKHLMDNMGKVIVGKDDVIELITLAFMCNGHVLIEDVPGTGKTTLALALAKSIGGQFNRISCTPDVMPSDITGFTMYNPKHERFEYHEGAIMANIFLADEINRTPPKTQSGLLEAMEEHHVTVDGKHYDLPDPFMVIATQNPVEYLGTYPLPEAQMDRFIIKMHIGYPDLEEELLIMERFKDDHPLKDLQPVISLEEVHEIQQAILSVTMDPSIQRYVLSLVRETRESKQTLLGVSPRGSLFLSRMAKAKAYFSGRDYVIPDDVKNLFVPVCAHRMMIKPEMKYENQSSEDILEQILKKVNVPAGEFIA
mgnify:FL=1